jgi:hypothetical protein
MFETLRDVEVGLDARQRDLARQSLALNQQAVTISFHFVSFENNAIVYRKQTGLKQ